MQRRNTKNNKASQTAKNNEQQTQKQIQEIRLQHEITLEHEDRILELNQNRKLLYITVAVLFVLQTISYAMSRSVGTNTDPKAGHDKNEVTNFDYSIIFSGVFYLLAVVGQLSAKQQLTNRAKAAKHTVDEQSRFDLKDNIKKANSLSELNNLRVQQTNNAAAKKAQLSKIRTLESQEMFMLNCLSFISCYIHPFKPHVIPGILTLADLAERISSGQFVSPDWETVDSRLDDKINLLKEVTHGEFILDIKPIANTYLKFSQIKITIKGAKPHKGSPEFIESATKILADVFKNCGVKPLEVSGNYLLLPADTSYDLELIKKLNQEFINQQINQNSLAKKMANSMVAHLEKLATLMKVKLSFSIDVDDETVTLKAMLPIPKEYVDRFKGVKLFDLTDQLFVRNKKNDQHTLKLAAVLFHDEKVSMQAIAEFENELTKHVMKQNTYVNNNNTNPVTITTEEGFKEDEEAKQQPLPKSKPKAAKKFDIETNLHKQKLQKRQEQRRKNKEEEERAKEQRRLLVEERARNSMAKLREQAENLPVNEPTTATEEQLGEEIQARTVEELENHQSQEDQEGELGVPPQNVNEILEAEEEITDEIEEEDEEEVEVEVEEEVVGSLSALATPYYPTRRATVPACLALADTYDDNLQNILNNMSDDKEVNRRAIHLNLILLLQALVPQINTLISQLNVLIKQPTKRFRTKQSLTAARLQLESTRNILADLITNFTFAKENEGYYLSVENSSIQPSLLAMVRHNFAQLKNISGSEEMRLINFLTNPIYLNYCPYDIQVVLKPDASIKPRDIAQKIIALIDEVKIAGTQNLETANPSVIQRDNLKMILIEIGALARNMRDEYYPDANTYFGHTLRFSDYCTTTFDYIKAATGLDIKRKQYANGTFAAELLFPYIQRLTTSGKLTDLQLLNDCFGRLKFHELLLVCIELRNYIHETSLNNCNFHVEFSTELALLMIKHLDEKAKILRDVMENKITSSNTNTTTITRTVTTTTTTTVTTTTTTSVPMYSGMQTTRLLFSVPSQNNNNIEPTTPRLLLTMSQDDNDNTPGDASEPNSPNTISTI